MKKILISLFLLLAGAVAALPWVNGMVMEKLAHETLSNLNQASGDNGLKYEILEYRRGYKRTHALWKVDLNGNELVFSETATHGWAQVSSEISLEENPWYADWVKAREKDPMSIRVRYSAFGPIVTEIRSDPVFVDEGDKAFRIGGLDLRVSMDKAISKVSSSGTWEGMSSEDDPSRIGQVVIQSEMERVSGPVWQGGGTVAFKRLTVKGGKERLSLSNLELKTDTVANKAAGLMDSFLSVRVDGIEVSGQSLSDWALGLNLKNMDIQAVGDLSRLYGEMAGRMAQVLSDPDLSPEKRNLALRPLMVENRMALIAQFEKLLNKGFGLDISPVDMTLPQGQIKGHLSLSLLKDMTLAGFFPVAVRPDLALEIFFLDSDISLPAEFGRIKPSLTLPLFEGMQTGLFVPEGDRLRHRAHTRDAVLYLNGERVDLGI